MYTILGLIGALIGMFFFRAKAQNAASLNVNLESKNKVNDESKQIAKNEGLLQAEQEKREAIQKATGVEVQKELNNEELSDFFSSRKPKQ